MDFVNWVLWGLISGFFDIFRAFSSLSSWLAWIFEINAKSISSFEVKQSLMRFIYYGGSQEFLFSILSVFVIITILGLFWHSWLWNIVRRLESFANIVGQIFAWSGLAMVIQQICIVFLQRIFAVSEFPLIVMFNIANYDVSWWAEMLKLHNALLVTLCCTYTFVQGGHVRVDLLYSHFSFRTKKIVDAIGSLLFMMPLAVFVWLYGWFFMWRHLIVPKPSASDALEKLLLKARALRWNVETIGFSPNGFNAYFVFKILLVMFAFMIFLQAIAFFYRSMLEAIENEENQGKILARDE